MAWIDSRLYSRRLRITNGGAIEETPKVTSMDSKLMARVFGYKLTPENGNNAYMSFVPNCICCEKPMHWIKTVAGTFHRCETEHCPQFRIEFKPLEFKLERADGK